MDESPTDLDAPGLAGLRIARAEAGDAPELLVLQRACWVAEALANDTLAIPALHESLDDVERGIAEQQTWVVRDGPRLVGSVRGKVAGDAWEIGRLMVAPDLAGRGLGRFLLGWIEQHAPTGVARLVLFTGARSSRNLRIYGNAGYVLERSVDGVAHLAKPAGNRGAGSTVE
ncbi:GNAT family N-acetyltransferase [Pseudolysinimonas yzui]|uniref:tRNA (Guanine-N1)-methyltransferase n=1 Tax=Pseudolysinimonas yzui TaxID=2708254 RepID=A0A8J3GS99_9MICO|nr:GNAT family N-acetyltransferase [Pseudolysinimonas yzui]GHF22266.1 tRNA (guanine-N1)-methyltransferase [Pseudolysinimonas yzui]